MTTHPETAADFAESNKCICCKRSKSGGSFFEFGSYQDNYDEGVPTWFPFSYGAGGWDADIDVFQEASRQGCQRCAVAFDMVTTWLEDIPRSDRRHITVQNGSDSDSMVANVRVYLTVLHGFLTDENCVALELLSTNRRYPKQKSYRLCGHSKSNEPKTGIQLA